MAVTVHAAAEEAHGLIQAEFKPHPHAHSGRCIKIGRVVATIFVVARQELTMNGLKLYQDENGTHWLHLGHPLSRTRSLQAEYTGRAVSQLESNLDMKGIALMRYWVGTVTTAPVIFTVPSDGESIPSR